jgi:hypothetical protein
MYFGSLFLVLFTFGSGDPGYLSCRAIPLASLHVPHFHSWHLVLCFSPSWYCPQQPSSCASSVCLSGCRGAMIICFRTMTIMTPNHKTGGRPSAYLNRSAVIVEQHRNQHFYLQCLVCSSPLTYSHPSLTRVQILFANSTTSCRKYRNRRI